MLFNQLKLYIPSMVAESWGSHTGTRADQETTPSQTTLRKERDPHFGSSWVFRQSQPPHLPAIDSHLLALSMTERSQPVVSPALIGLSVPPVPPSVGGLLLLQLSVEAEVSHSPATILIIEVPCSSCVS